MLLTSPKGLNKKNVDALHRETARMVRGEKIQSIALSFLTHNKIKISDSNHVAIR